MACGAVEAAACLLEGCIGGCSRCPGCDVPNRIVDNAAVQHLLPPSPSPPPPPPAGGRCCFEPGVASCEVCTATPREGRGGWCHESATACALCDATYLFCAGPHSLLHASKVPLAWQQQAGGDAATTTGGGNGDGGDGGSRPRSPCRMGVLTEHPTPAGFRVTVARWVAQAEISWRFDHAVAVASSWGPVRVTRAHGTTLTFALKGSAPPHIGAIDGRADQWGFVLDRGYEGSYAASCEVLPPRPRCDPGDGCIICA